MATVTLPALPAELSSLKGFQSILYSRSAFKLLDQLKLPHENVTIDIPDVTAAWIAIRVMNVRGAPAIAISAVLALAHQLHTEVFTTDTLPATTAVPADAVADDATAAAIAFQRFASADAIRAAVLKRLAFLGTSRPTAVNLFNAIRDFEDAINGPLASETCLATIAAALILRAEALFVSDYQDNIRMGDHGAAHILAEVAAGRASGRKDTNGTFVNVLTHCNTGTLATAYYGTALGVVRSIAKGGNLGVMFADETRPYNQGARLTVTEAVGDGIPTVLIADSAACAVMHGQCVKDVDEVLSAARPSAAAGYEVVGGPLPAATPTAAPAATAAGRFATTFGGSGVDVIVVGADRICRNGDTANKIGTFSVAVAAASAGVPFYVAAPWTTIDTDLLNGSQIPIEQRSASELTHFRGERVVVDSPLLRCLNPSFDVVPAQLIAGIITEKGVVRRREDGTFDLIEQRAQL